MRKYKFHRMNTNILQTLITAMQRRLAALPQRLRPFTTEFDELPKNLMLTGAEDVANLHFYSIIHKAGAYYTFLLIIRRLLANRSMT